MHETRREEYQQYVRANKDIGLQIQFMERKKNADTVPQEVEDESEMHHRRRQKLRELYQEEEERAALELERNLRLAREAKEKELEERAARIAAERESSRRNFVTEKLRQLELEMSEDRRKEKADQLHSEFRDILDIQVVEKRNKARAEAVENELFDELWKQECSKKELRDTSDKSAAAARASELKKSLDEQVSVKQNPEKVAEPETGFPQNCFWNGTLHNSKPRPVPVVKDLPPVLVSNKQAEMQREIEENAKIVRDLIEVERRRALQEAESWKKQRETMRVFFEESVKDRQRSLELDKEAEKIVNESCERVSREIELRQREEKANREAMLVKTLEIRNKQLQEQKQRKETSSKQKEKDRIEAERLAQIAESEYNTVRNETKERMKAYGESLLKQIFEKQTYGN